MKSDKKKKKNVIKVDFTGVETRVLLPEGQYHAKVGETSVEEGSGEHDYIKWVFIVVDDDPKLNGKKLFYNTSLSPQSLWNLRNLLETLGVETPSSATDLDLDECIDLELMVRIEHETWEGKDRAKVTDFTPIDETAEVDDDEKPKKGKADEEDEEDEEEEEETEETEEEEDDDGKVSADEVREMDTDELKDLCKKHKLKIDLDKIPKASKRIAAVIDALEAKDLLAE